MRSIKFRASPTLAASRDDKLIDRVRGAEKCRDWGFFHDSVISCIDDCCRHGISTAVMHITRLSSKPSVSSIGLDRIKRLVDFAEKMQIDIALENMDSIQHLDFIFANIKSERLGFCYDSEHEYYNHPKADCLSRYGDKLFAVHLDDNFGGDDTHLLPFDGAVNWKRVMLNLSKCKEIRYLTLEADKSLIYEELTAGDFLSLVHAKLLKLLNEESHYLRQMNK